MPWKDSGFSCFRSLKDGRRIALVLEGLGILEPPFPQGGPQEPRAPGRRARRSHASRDGRILQPLKMAFGLWAESAMEGVGIRVPRFP